MYSPPLHDLTGAIVRLRRTPLLQKPDSPALRGWTTAIRRRRQQPSQIELLIPLPVVCEKFGVVQCPVEASTAPAGHLATPRAAADESGKTV